MKAAQLGLFEDGSPVTDSERKRLIRNFALLACSAGGPKRLRDVILHAACRGSLVAQLPSEGTGDAIVRSLPAARKKIEPFARVRTDLSPLLDSEKPFEIPASWSWVRLGELGGFLGGGTPAKSNAAFWNGPIPWVSPKDMKRPYIDDAEDHISMAAVQGSATKLIPRGSLLFVVRGMILAHSFPVALTTGEVTINQDMKAFVPAVPDCAEYLLRVCWAARVRVLSRVERSSHGTCRLDSAVVEQLPIPLPPLAEQKRIVARVEQLMALCDELEAKQTRKRDAGERLTKAALAALTSADSPEELQVAWKRVAGNFDELIDQPEKVQALRTNIIELAMRGMLTARAEGDEAVDQLLGRILAEQKTAGVAKVQARDELQPMPFLIPRSWCWVRWGDLTLATSSGWSPQCENRPREGDAWGVLKVSAVSWFQFKSEENKALPAGVAPRSEFAVRDGDFLMSRANTSDLVGRSVIVEQAPEHLILSDKIVRCVFSRWIDKRFVNLYNRTATARAHYVAHASGTSDSMKNISRDVILSMPVPLPPLAEQQRIVARVEQLMKLCDDLEAKLRARDQKAARLAAALVAEAIA